MERILVSMNAQQAAWEAWSRAISLVKRIGRDARIYALLIVPQPHSVSPMIEKDIKMIRERFELQIELAESEGIHIDYYVTEGNYEDEVVRFAEQNKITLLVLESLEEGKQHAKRGGDSLRKIIHRIPCRVELVTPRRITTT